MAFTDSRWLRAYLAAAKARGVYEHALAELQRRAFGLSTWRGKLQTIPILKSQKHGY